MARDMLKKKQRIAHNSISHEMVSAGHALVSGFIEEIKNDFSLNCRNFEPNLPTKTKIIPEPIQNHVSVPRAKKSRNSHKFPLMESATRTLKHIKHNRQISKPKAHLATLSDSSPDHSPCYNNSILREKSKKTNPVKIDRNNNTNHESAIIPKNSVGEKSRIVNSDKISDDSSDSNMFESFVAKNRLKNYKKLPNITKRIIPKRTKYVSQESDSDMSDKSFYCTKSKRIKSCQVTSKGGSESEMDIVNDMDHNSDSDDDDLPAPSEIFSCLIPDTYNASQSIKQLDNAASEFNSSSNKTCPTPFERNVHFLASSDISSVGVKEEPHTKESSDKASSPKNDQSNSKCFTTKTGSILNNSNESVIVDLTESDNECENSFISMPKISDQISNNSHSEESEVELVDVIVPELLENTNMKCADKNVRLPGMQILNNRNIKTERDSNIVRKVAPVSVAKSGSISIEQTNQSSIISNIENSQILSTNVKKEPSYDDCEIVLDIASTTNSNLNLAGVQTCDNTNIKIKNYSKVVEQVTPVHVDSNDSIATKQNSKLTQKEQKLRKATCSNTRNLTDCHNKNSELLENERMTESGSENIVDLVENMKKEFFTYREIVQTGVSVENTFKLLEKCQAEKLKSLNAKIAKLLECGQGNTVDKVLVSSELSSSPSLKDCSNVSSDSDISLQDLKTFATMNLVPLSSISENDIKPNISELQFALKQEPGTSGRRNSMDKNLSFGQKCMVCNKDASAACQQCCKVFFCSNECGNKYWENGHKNACKYL